MPYKEKKIAVYCTNHKEDKHRGADKSLARPGRKQATATEDFDVHISLFIIIIGWILVLFKYVTRLASNAIFSPSNKIHREVGQAKDLSAPRYNVYRKCRFSIQKSNGKCSRLWTVNYSISSVIRSASWHFKIYEIGVRLTLFDGVQEPKLKNYIALCLQCNENLQVRNTIHWTGNTKAT